MKLSCSQEKFNKGLSAVKKIISNSRTLPILNNILLATDNGRLKLVSTDLEIGITTWIGAKIEQNGSITVPSNLIADFISNNTDEKINLELKEQTIELSSPHYQAHIKGMEASEFPLIPELKNNKLLNIPVKDFLEAIKKTIFACATDESRPILGGVFLKTKNKELKLVTTDSFRLAEATLDLEKPASDNISAIIPARTMLELARILPAAGETVDIYLGENQILFIMGETQLISRLIEGNFPDYQQIIPQDCQNNYHVPVMELTNAIRMASLFAKDNANNIKLNFNKENLTVSAISPQLGDNVSTVKLTSSKGEELEVAFNAKFILDILNVMETEEIRLANSGKLQPSLISLIGDKRFLYIIMPLRIED